MADKLLLVTTFIVLTIPSIPLTNYMPFWLTVLIISRDIVIVGVVAIVNLAVGPRTFRPSLCGKLTTGTYILTSMVFLYFNYLHQTSWIIDTMIGLSLCMTFISGGDYYFRMRKLINDQS